MPAILLTGYAGDDAALALGRLFDGAVSLMRKPVTDDQLLDRLSAMLAAGGPATRPARVTQEVC
jgi:FixJ family two-component response regulator